MEFLTKIEDLELFREQSKSKQYAHHVVVIDENMHTTSEETAKNTSGLKTWVDKSGPREASCKGVLDNVRTTYRRRTELQLESLTSLRRI